MHEGQSRCRMGPVTLGCSLARVSRECVIKDETRAYDGRVGQARGASELPLWEADLREHLLASEPISRTSSRTGVPSVRRVHRWAGWRVDGQGAWWCPLAGCKHQNKEGDSRMKKKNRATSVIRRGLARPSPTMARTHGMECPGWTQTGHATLMVDLGSANQLRSS